MIRTALILSDIHVPFQHDKLLSNVIAFGKKIKVDEVIILGDFLDCYSISKFDSKPNRADDFNYELEMAKDLLKRIKQISKKTTFIQGNHCERLPKLLMRGKNRALYSIDALRIENLLGLKELGINYVEGLLQLNKDTIAIHGTRCGLEPAKGEAMSYLCNGISGHSHKSSVYRRSFLNKKISWFSVPCMCDIKSLDYAASFSHAWDLGFAVMKYDTNYFDVKLYIANNNGEFIT